MLYLELQNFSREVKLTVVEIQHLPDIEKTDSKKNSCLRRKSFNSRQKICVKFKSDAENFNIVVYRYRNNLFFKDNEVYYSYLQGKEIYLNLTEYVTVGKTNLSIKIN